ncbi:MAG TPA: divergent polysaccharide deacetylase family protein, partial [Candidatus Krumholzibacteria bacterium]|nr:divergent polysaccharide deacetylase family protein [Candidatus Krumholzibacteria bacterium]
DPRVMRAVCAALKPYGVFFLDSLTSPKSVAYTVAVESGLPAVSNTLFLDDATDRREDVEDRIHELVDRARRHGVAVGIGHPHPWTLEALSASIDFLDAANVELVTVCELVANPATATATP